MRDPVLSLSRSFPVLPVMRRRRGWIAGFALAALWLAGSPAPALDLGQPAVEGAGEVQREARGIEAVRGLKLQTLARVVIRQGERDAVEVQAEGNLLPLIETRVERGTLVVEDRRRIKSSRAEVTVTVRRLDELEAGGVTAVQAEGLRSPVLSVSAGGASTLALTGLAVDRLHLSLGGASSATLSGSAAELSLSLGGTASARAAQLEARRASVSTGGTAHAVVWATQSLHVDAGGVSGVRYYGVSRAQMQISGLAQVDRLGSTPPRAL